MNKNQVNEARSESRTYAVEGRSAGLPWEQSMAAQRGPIVGSLAGGDLGAGMRSVRQELRHDPGAAQARPALLVEIERHAESNVEDIGALIDRIDSLNERLLMMLGRFGMGHLIDAPIPETWGPQAPMAQPQSPASGAIDRLTRLAFGQSEVQSMARDRIGVTERLLTALERLA